MTAPTTPTSATPTSATSTSATPAVRPIPRKPPKVRARAIRLDDAVDGTFFVVGALMVIWLGVILVVRQLTLSWETVVTFVAYWALLAYVALPRLQEVLARIYVPDYFIGRSVTGQGILGDPVNLGADGSEAQLHSALQRAGWIRADEITLGSSWGIVVSSVLRRSYPSAPVSPLLLFGRKQSVAYQQEVDGNASQRHHVRFWPTPEGWLLPGGGRAGWLGAATYDRRVGLALVTHQGTPNVDPERDHVVETVRRHNPASDVRVIEAFSSAFHARNGGGDRVHTDGNLPILDLTALLPDDPDRPADALAAPAAPPPKKTVARRHLPPPQLLVAGVVSLVKTGFAVVASVTTAASTTSLVSTGLTAAVMVALWGLTLARWAWARLLLMVVCGVEAVTRLVALSQAERGHYYLSLTTGLSLLVLIAVSSTSARRWVD